MLTAGVYSSTLHYLKAVAAAGTDEPKAGDGQMRENCRQRRHDQERQAARGRPPVRDMYLFQVKSPAESKGRTTSTS